MVLSTPTRLLTLLPTADFPSSFAIKLIPWKEVGSEFFLVKLSLANFSFVNVDVVDWFVIEVLSSVMDGHNWFGITIFSFSLIILSSKTAYSITLSLSFVVIGVNPC